MKSKRTAHSLGEMLIVMMLMTVLMPSAVNNVRRMMVASRRSSESLELLRVARSLSYQWRLDVHRASSADVNATPSGDARLELIAPSGERIEYEVRSQELVRRVIRKDGMIQEESYSRTLTSVARPEDLRGHPPAWNAHWKRDGKAVTLTIDSLPQEYRLSSDTAAAESSVKSYTKRVTHVVATLGRDHRHHGPVSALVGGAK